MSPTSRPYDLARSVGVLSLISLLSPLAGLLLELVLALRFGASGTVDAFRIVSLLLVLGSQLFFGTWLPQMVIPLYAEFRAKGLEPEGRRLILAMGLVLSLAGLGLLSWIWLKPESLVGFLAPGMPPESRGEAFLLMRYGALALPLIMWSGLISCVLQSHQIFWTSPVSQLVSNLLMVAALLLTGRAWGAGALVLGVLSGAGLMLVLHLGCLVWLLQRQGIAAMPAGAAIPWATLGRTLSASIPIIGTLLVGQWSSVAMNRTLSLLPVGTLAGFGYAWKLLMLMSIMPTSLSTVVFPSLSDASARRDPTAFSRLATRAVRMTLVLSVPLSAALYMAGETLIELIFARGAMSAIAIAQIGEIFGILVLGAPASLVLGMLTKIAFSLQDTRAPALTAVASAIGISLILPEAARLAGASGVAWAWNAIVVGSVLLLWIYQTLRYRITPPWEITGYAGSMALLAGGIILSATLVRYAFRIASLPPTAAVQAAELGLVMLSALLVVSVMARVLRIKEPLEIHDFLVWQLAKRSPKLPWSAASFRPGRGGRRAHYSQSWLGTNGEQE